MKTFTFDHNVIIDLEERREPNYGCLVEFLNDQFAQIAITAVSASENPPIDNFSEFKQKIQAIPELSKIKDGQILKPLGIWGLSFWSWCLWGNKSMDKLKTDISMILFPNFSTTKDLKGKARNQLADIMMFWCHVYHNRDIFVTSDRNFMRRKDALKKVAFDFNGAMVNIVKPCQVIPKDKIKS